MKSDVTEKGSFKDRIAPYWETVKTLFWAAVIAIGCRVFAYEPFNIPSGSMLPTLKIGDYLFIWVWNVFLPVQPGCFFGPHSGRRP